MLKLQFETNNSDFGDDDGPNAFERRIACARILRELADSITEGETEGRVIDANGNKIGSYKLA